MYYLSYIPHVKEVTYVFVYYVICLTKINFIMIFEIHFHETWEISALVRIMGLCSGIAPGREKTILGITLRGVTLIEIEEIYIEILN